MARKPRLHVPGALYHVIWRGNEQRDIFFDEDDRYRFYELLGEGVPRFGYRVHGFCLMSNHVHLVLQAGKDALSAPLQNLAFRYTQAINRKRKRVGHLFHGRYKALLVDQDSYLLELVRYIHLNPVRAHLVADPAELPWSAHRAYLGEVILPWLTTEAVLGQLGGSLGVARRRYARFVAEGIAQGHRSEFHSGRLDPRVIGDDRFIEGLQRHTSLMRPGSGRRSTLDDLVGYVCAGYGIEEGALRAPGRERVPAKARALIGWLAVQTKAAPLMEVAQRFDREPSGLSRQVVRLGQQAREDEGLARLLDRHFKSLTHA